MSSKEDPVLGNVIALPMEAEDRNHLWQKTKLAFEYVSKFQSILNRPIEEMLIQFQVKRCNLIAYLFLLMVIVRAHHSEFSIQFDINCERFPPVIQT